MFCLQEKDHNELDFNATDPLSQSDDDDHDDHDDHDHDPPAKRLKLNSLNLQVIQIPPFNGTSIPKSLSIYPSTPVLPKFVNNPLNLANPLALANEANNIVKNLQTRFSLPAKLTITPVQNKTPVVTDTGEVIRYKKNGEIAKKRGPPKGYKRKPKVDLSQSLNLATALQTQNTILTSLLAAHAPPGLTILPTTTNNEHTQPKQHIITQHIIAKPKLEIIQPVPRIKVPDGVELVELDLDPADFFPEEPYKMVFSRKKNPKWKEFPYRCEHCFKGYRVPTTLLAHSAIRHGSVPKSLSFPCPCCPHVSTSKLLHKKHLHIHAGRKHRIFCVYCLPTADPTETYIKESEKYPFDKFPQYWYASEESLRLHKKRKHPYSAMFPHSWYCTWMDNIPSGPSTAST